MPGVFDRVTTGQPLAGIRAESWNAMLAAAEAFAQGRANQPAGPPRQWGKVEALALNSTGADLREYKPAAVTAAGGYTLSDDTPAADWNRRPLLTLGIPAADTDWVVVTLEAIPAGAIGRVAVSGVCLVDIASASSGSTRWAKATAGSTASLTASATVGTVRVLHVPSTGTPKRCAVYLHERPGAAELCDSTPSVRRELIGVYVVKSGANVTDVYQRFEDVTTDANGCVTRGAPYCVIAPETCDTSRDPEYWCISGVCWKYYDGIVPGSYDAGPFSTPELCDAGCPASEPILMTCGGFDFTYPESVTYSLANPTGCFEAFSEAAPTVLLNPAGPGTCSVNYGTDTGQEFDMPAACIGGGAFPASWGVLMAPETTPGPTYTGNVVQSVGMNKVPAASMGGYQWRFTGASGFSNVAANGFSSGLSTRTVTGVDARPPSPVHVGLVEILNPSSVVVGSADVYFE